MGIIGASIGAAGSIIGGIANARAARQQRNRINDELKENQNWYDRRYNEDATQRADAQAVLTRTEEFIKNRNQAAAGSQAVMGGTDESVAASKEANNKVLSDTTSNISANAERRKDAIEGQYLNRKTKLNDDLNELDAQQANNTAAAIQGITGAASSMDFGNTKKDGTGLDL